MKMVETMREAASTMTLWLKDKLLPWLVIATICMVLGMARQIITLQGQIELLRSEIKNSMLQTMREIATGQVANTQLIIRTEACAKENRTIIDMVVKRLDGIALK